jgi:hypothetical protein
MKIILHQPKLKNRKKKATKTKEKQREILLMVKKRIYKQIRINNPRVNKLNS